MKKKITQAVSTARNEDIVVVATTIVGSIGGEVAWRRCSVWKTW